MRKNQRERERDKRERQRDEKESERERDRERERSETVDMVTGMSSSGLDGELSLAVHLSESSTVQAGYQGGGSCSPGGEPLHPCNGLACCDQTGTHTQAHTHS